jgi:hypothetical protein
MNPLAMHIPRDAGLRPMPVAREIEVRPTPQPIKGSFLIISKWEMRNDPFLCVRSREPFALPKSPAWAGGAGGPCHRQAICHSLGEARDE